MLQRCFTVTYEITVCGALMAAVYKKLNQESKIPYKLYNGGKKSDFNGSKHWQYFHTPE